MPPRTRAATRAAPLPALGHAVLERREAVAIRAPWTRATPVGAKVAAGYVALVNGGARADRLVGASIPQAGRTEIRAMSMENGVMRMAPVEGGLPIEPGRTVELKPGGYHLMFLDLRDGLRAGETVRGSLTFARAGTVPVTFTVAPVGARGPGGGTGSGSSGPAPAGAHHH